VKRYDCHVGEYFERSDGEFVRYQDAQTEIFFLERWRRESEKSHERKDAELEQLRGTLSLAEEGLANYAQENERLNAFAAEQAAVIEQMSADAKERSDENERLRAERASAIDRITPLGLEMGQFRRALEIIRDGEIPQAMSPALFAEFVLEKPVPPAEEHAGG
jgi:chromosome segregation ATPase